MISINSAFRLIRRQVEPLGVETVELANSVGRVLAEEIVADGDLPPFDRSQMDGYAIVAADTLKTPVDLKIVGESAAGNGWYKKLGRGQAVRIMTGAPVPGGADAVQKVEVTTEQDGSVTIHETAKKGNAIVRRGAEVKKGKRIFASGTRVTTNMIAALASFGYAKIRVARRPRVAILATGSEIVDVRKRPGRGQIRNSNSVMIDVLCREFGCETTVLPIVGDDISDLTSRISLAAKKADIVIVTGGVSIGKYDHTKTALADLGAEIYVEKVRLKPGKPMVFARLGKALFFGLPGNPVSAAVTFHLFVRRAIMQMQGSAETEQKNAVAILGADAAAPQDRDAYIAATLSTNTSGHLVALPLRSKGSSDFVSFAHAQCLIVVTKGTRGEKGSSARIVIL